MDHMKKLAKQVNDALSGATVTKRPRLQGSLLPPKVPKLTPRTQPKPKESKYRFL